MGIMGLIGKATLSIILTLFYAKGLEVNLGYGINPVVYMILFTYILYVLLGFRTHQSLLLLLIPLLFIGSGGAVHLPIIIVIILVLVRFRGSIIGLIRRIRLILEIYLSKWGNGMDEDN